MSANDRTPENEGAEREDADVVDLADVRDEAPSELLAKLTREAKAGWVPMPWADRDDSSEAERALLARIDAHTATIKRRAVLGGPGVWGPVAFVAAVAAGALIFARSQGEIASDAPHVPASPATVTVPEGPAALPPSTTPEPPRPTAPATLALVTAGGDLRVDGVRAGSERVSVRDGQLLEAHGGVAAFTAPGRVEWLLESGTEVTASRAGTRGGAIVLALNVGAVEAQVTPVPAGEAFAVDVDGVRVAVHGTHLRVARDRRGGDAVVVDLSEGVILVGAPPKTGTTMGELVTAPAHVEFRTSDLRGTFRVDHDASHVRTPVDPASPVQAREAPHATQASRVVAPPAARVASEMPATSPPAPPPPPTEESMPALVQSCADEVRYQPPEGVTARSSGTVNIKTDGTVAGVVFVPPVQPDVQTCVVNRLLPVRFTEPGPLHFAVEIHR